MPTANNATMRGAFIAWVAFQRRVTILADLMPVDVHWLTTPWEGRGAIYKAAAYLIKFARTIGILHRAKPAFVMVQLPPTPALYACSIYSSLTRTPLVADCHNSAVNEHWKHWPLTRQLLRRAHVVVHNENVVTSARQNLGVDASVLRTGILSSSLVPRSGPSALSKLQLVPYKYVVLPWSLHVDEPVDEALAAMRLASDTTFVLTGSPKKLTETQRASLPPNLMLTGYLAEADFNEIFASAGAALVLTTRTDTQLSGMAEAMAFSVPAVISDNETTRLLYRDAPVYVDHHPESLVAGVKRALAERDNIVRRSDKVRDSTQQEVERQVAALLSHVRGSNENTAGAS